jgi:aspartate-semialdehyde dehydrogenase
MKYKIAVVGATGNVGTEILNILSQRNFPVKEVVALASSDSLGKEVSFGETIVLKAQGLNGYDFSGTDIALFSPGSEISRIHAPIAAKAGCIVIDNTSCFRMDEDIPLIVPEVNLNDLIQYKNRNIIANPNCSTIQMVMALKPLHDFNPIKRVVVSTYQAVSGAGRQAMDELYNQTKGVFTYQQPKPYKFPKQIAFNIIPHIDEFMDDGATREEWKMQVETKKIMGGEIGVNATCVRVPVFIGHCLSLNIEFTHEFALEQMISLLQNAHGVSVLDLDRNGEYTTPIEVAQEDDVFISRVRRDPTIAHGLNMWVVADNLRKGAALNAVQIAEALIKHYL